MSQEDEDLKFDSHNGMSRVPMFWGIPVFPLIFCVLGTFITGVIGISVFGAKGLIFPLPFILLALFIRVISERDDKAMRRFIFSIRRWRRNRKYGRHLLITPRNPKWSVVNVQRQAKKRVLNGE
jgi:type IV secretory pathway VirB3-like protein